MFLIILGVLGPPESILKGRGVRAEQRGSCGEAVLCCAVLGWVGSVYVVLGSSV